MASEAPNKMSDSDPEKYPSSDHKTDKFVEPRYVVKATGAMPVIRYFGEQDRLQVRAMDPEDRKVYKWCKMVPGVTVAHGGDLGKKRPREEVVDDVASSWAVTNETESHKDVRGLATAQSPDTSIEQGSSAPIAPPTIAAHSKAMVMVPMALQSNAMGLLEWNADLYSSVSNASLTQIAQHQLLKRTAGNWFGAEEDSVLPMDTILIRKWHTDLWERHSENLGSGAHVLIIVGPPGIGKSLGLNYILWKYLTAPQDVQKKRYVVLILPNTLEYYLFDTRDKQACRVSPLRQEGLLVHLEPFAGNILVLHDLGRDAPLTKRTLPTVLATSPTYDKYKEFSKAPNKHFFFVPMPTDAELDFMATHMMPPDHNYDVAWTGSGKTEPLRTWQQVAHFYGNVPRCVFGPSSCHTAIESQITNLSLETIRTCPSGEAQIDVNDWLVDYVPKSEYGGFMVRFRQGYVAERLADRMFQGWLAQWDTIVNFTHNGHVFEVIVHEFLARYPTSLLGSNIVPLLDKTQKGGAKLDSKVISSFLKDLKGKKRMRSYSGSIINLGSYLYYYPAEGSFPVIDSFVFIPQVAKKKISLLCFRMTIAASHKTKGSTLRDLLGQLSARFSYDNEPLEIVLNDKKWMVKRQSPPFFDLEIHLVYIVSHANYDTFRRQELKDPEGFDSLWDMIHQYKCKPPSSKLD